MSCFAVCASVSRSAILYDLHPHSQVSGLVTAAVLLPVLLFLTVLFTHLPMCVLASIIMVALKGKPQNESVDSVF
jgi:MFS superfamily sulfate permease-like transporter